MGIKQFSFERPLVDSFVQFGYDLYCEDPRWIPPLRRDLYTQLSPDFGYYLKPGNMHRNFLAVSCGRIVGRASAMVNRELKNEEGSPTGLVGFFESVDDFSVARDLLDAATHWLSDGCGIRCIWGPMNFDIWHGYRFMTHGFDRAPFLGEPYNKPYYPDFFERYGFSPKQHWDSVELHGREVLEAAIAHKSKYYKHFLEVGYRFEDFDTRRFGDELGKLWSLMRESFRGFLGFTDVSLEEFRRLFAPSFHAFRSRLFTFVYDEQGTLVGFAGAFLDLADAVRKMGGRSNLLSRVRFLLNRNHTNRINFFLGGMLPGGGMRRAGLGRAGFCHILQRILHEGYENVVVALMARGNKVQGLLNENGVERSREYTLYELMR